MQIGFDAKRLFLNNRGLGSYARNLLYGLAKYYPGNNYVLYTPKVKNEYTSPALINSENVKIGLPVGLHKLNTSYWRSAKLGSILARDQLDIFHGLAQELPNDIKRFKGKSVVTVHDLIFLQRPEFYKPIDRWIYTKKVKFAIEKADSIIAISESTKRDIIENFGADEDKLHVVYQSCNEVFYEKRKDVELKIVKQKWNLPDEYILYVGALNGNKNVLAILKAMTLLPKDIVLPLAIVGHGKEYRETLSSFINSNNLDDLVIFASDIANPSTLELSSIYQMASLFIFPSYYEGFGIPILEARFSGIPVIASNSSCLDEAGGDQTLYFDPDNPAQLAEQIENTLNNPIEFDSSVEEFRINNSLRIITEIYSRLNGE